MRRYTSPTMGFLTETVDGEQGMVTVLAAEVATLRARSSGLEQFALQQGHRLRLLWARSPVLYSGHEAT